MKETLPALIIKLFGSAMTVFRSFFFSFIFRKAGFGLKILEGVKVSGSRNIILGKNCFIGRHVVLDASHGQLIVEDGVEIRDHARIYAQTIHIGSGTTLGEGSLLNGNIMIRPGAWISRGCDLSGEVEVEKAILGPYTACVGGPGHDQDTLTGAYQMSSRSDRFCKVTIRAGAWTGFRSIILSSVTIESNMLVGAGAVVTKNFSAGQRVAGIPAKPIA